MFVEHMKYSVACHPPPASGSSIHLTFLSAPIQKGQERSHTVVLERSLHWKPSSTRIEFPTPTQTQQLLQLYKYDRCMSMHLRVGFLSDSTGGVYVVVISNTLALALGFRSVRTPVRRADGVRRRIAPKHTVRTNWLALSICIRADLRTACLARMGW